MSAQVTRADIDALVGPATPQFAYQLRARLRELVVDLPAGHELSGYAAEMIDLLDRLGYASSKAEEGPHEPSTRLGWKQLPSSARADSPLPKRIRHAD
jgi:hypothetical protein